MRKFVGVGVLGRLWMVVSWGGRWRGRGTVRTSTVETFS